MTDLDAVARRECLRRVQMFCSLDDGDLAAVAEMATVRRVAAREELFHKGDAGQQLYVVVSGRLKVITTSNEGDDLIFCFADPGEVLGEVALLIDRPRTATVVAMQAAELIAIDRRDFQQLLRTRAEVAVGMLGLVAERLARVSEFVEDTQFLNLSFRLAKKINELIPAHGRRDGDSGPIALDLKLSQEEWGDLVGATRESINKQFKAWSESGLITAEQGHLEILDPDRMTQLADCLVL